MDWPSFDVSDPLWVTLASYVDRDIEQVLFDEQPSSPCLIWTGRRRKAQKKPPKETFVGDSLEERLRALQRQQSRNRRDSPENEILAGSMVFCHKKRQYNPRTLLYAVAASSDRVGKRAPKANRYTRLASLCGNKLCVHPRHHAYNADDSKRPARRVKKRAKVEVMAKIKDLATPEEQQQDTTQHGLIESHLSLYPG